MTALTIRRLGHVFNGLLHSGDVVRFRIRDLLHVAIQSTHTCQSKEPRLRCTLSSEQSCLTEALGPQAATSFRERRGTHDREFLLNGHHYLHCIQTVQSEITGERSGGRELLTSQRNVRKCVSACIRSELRGGLQEPGELRAGPGNDCLKASFFQRPICSSSDYHRLSRASEDRRYPSHLATISRRTLAASTFSKLFSTSEILF